MSSTWTRMSASASSSRVARKAATSSVGSFWMNPTVSLIKQGLPDGSPMRRAAGADAAFEPLEVTPLAGEARKQVLALGQLDLKARLARAGAAREDVDDQRSPVEDFDAYRFLKVSLLGWTQLVVEDDHRVVRLLPLGDYFLELALTDVMSGVPTLEAL